MKRLILLLAGAMAISSGVNGAEVTYELDVRGMVCAFCAYSVSKQLRSAEGVIPGSIDVDLQNGRITLRSDTALQAADLSERIERAGFELEFVNETPTEQIAQPVSISGPPIVSITIGAGGIAQEELDSLLEMIGAYSSERGAHLKVAGPVDLEMRIMRPILMGRTPAMDVEFTAAETIRMEVFTR